MISFADAREADATIHLSQLSSKQRDLYDKEIKHLRMRRVCSLCMCSFQLCTTSRCFGTKEFRDHVDYETEDFDSWDAISIDKEIAKCLVQQKVLTPQILFSETVDHKLTLHRKFNSARNKKCTAT